MKKALLLVAFAVAIPYVLFTEVSAMDKIKIIPEPSLRDMRDDDWSVDTGSMKRYYDNLFSGMGPEEIIAIFETESIQYKYISDSEIQFIPRKSFLPLLASYACVAVIGFEGGIFKFTKSVDMCGLIA